MRITDLAMLSGPAGWALEEEASVLASPEPVVVELHQQPEQGSLEEAAARLRRLPAPTLLRGSPGLPAALIAAVDVCVTSEPRPPRPWVTAELDDVVAAIRRQPLPALSLVALLRASESLSTWSAIASESATYALLLGSGPFQRWLRDRGPGRPKRHMRPPVAVDRSDTVLAITLDRPEARNAIDSVVRDALVEALRLAALDGTVAVELRGRGPCFSAGGDLNEFGTVRDPATAHAVRLTRHPGTAIAEVAARTTCYLHGTCIGAGIEIPAFASHVIADPDASFALPEVGMGLIPGAGGTVSITRRVGRQRAGWLALTGASIDVSTALGWGLVDRAEAWSR